MGSNQSELFDVLRNPDGSVSVRVFESDEDGERDREMYFRIFYPDETDEIRLYGQGDRDHFIVSGSSDESILVRIIGGEGNDFFNATSSVKGWASKTRFYDTEDGNEITEETEDNKESKFVPSDNQHIMRYDMESFKYDVLAPQVVFGFNTDDKIFIGGGASWTTHGFNKRPYSTYQRLVASVSPFRDSWSFDYTGDFVDVIGSLGINVETVLRAPNYFSNFYGFGNNTEIIEDDEFYEVFYNEFQAYAGLTIRSKRSLVKIGPQFMQYNAKRELETFITSYEDELLPDAFESNRYLGFKVESDVSTIENESFPERGVRWLSSLEYNGQTNNSHSKFGKLSTELRGYYTIEKPFDIILAGRIGGATLAGDFQFYQANTISGNRGFNAQGNVRGLVRDRFSGRSTFYQNIEVRIPVVTLPFYYLPFQLGVYTFLDNGRLWSDLDDSDVWHTSYGGGIFIRPAGMLVVTGAVNVSEEDTLFSVNIGFMF